MYDVVDRCDDIEYSDRFNLYLMGYVVRSWNYHLIIIIIIVKRCLQKKICAAMRIEMEIILENLKHVKNIFYNVTNFLFYNCSPIVRTLD